MSFLYKNLPAEKLRRYEFELISLNKVSIKDVYYKNLKTFVDGRGDLTELWSKPWSESEDVSNIIEHVYYNTTHENVIKAWHVHEHTFSQYTCVKGKLQVVLVDVREDSPTFLQVNQFIIGHLNPSLVKIPPGVLKGWKSLKDDSLIINLLTSSDTKDNFKYQYDLILQNIWEPHFG